MSNQQEPIIFTNQIDRQYMQKKQQQKRQARKESQIAWLLRLVFVVLLGAYLLSDYSKLRQISVFGNEALAKESIVSLSGLTLQTRYYGFVPWWSERQIRSHPLIDVVSISRKENQIVRIDVVEKKIMAYAHTDTLVWLLSDGSFVEIDKGSMDYMVHVPYIDGFDGHEDLLPKLAQYMSRIDSLTRSMISEIVLFPLDYDEEQLKVFMIDQNTIYVSLMDLENINGYQQLINAINDTGVCIYFDGEQGRAYTSECLD